MIRLLALVGRELGSKGDEYQLSFDAVMLCRRENYNYFELFISFLFLTPGLRLISVKRRQLANSLPSDSLLGSKGDN